MRRKKQCCGAGAGAALFGRSRSRNNDTFSAPNPADQPDKQAVTPLAQGAEPICTIVQSIG